MQLPAHANPRPPFPLREDQVLEIQRLVASMLYDAAGRPDATTPFRLNGVSPDHPGPEPELTAR
jgi:hypothetical protein